MIFKHYLELLRWYRWHVLVIIVLSTVTFGLIGYFQLKTAPKYTTAASVLLIPSEAELEFGLSDTTRRAGVQAMSETYMEYVKSRPVIETALAKIDAEMQQATEEPAQPSAPTSGFAALAERARSVLSGIKRKLTEFNTGTYVETPPDQKRVSEIQQAITVSNVASTHILRIQVTLDDPEYAALVANTLAEAYVERVTEQSNSDADELEAYLQKQISEKEAKLEELRAEKARLDERYGVGNAFVGSIEDQQRVEETQLADLHSRLLNVNLSKASTTATQARLIEPALPPPYVSSPGVINMTRIGLLVGVILAAASIVIRDMLSDTVKTSADLHRLVGTRSIGLLPRSRLWLVPRRSFRKFGLMVQQHFALSRLGSGSRSSSRRAAARLPAPSRKQAEHVYEGSASETGQREEAFWTRLNALAKSSQNLAHAMPPEEEATSRRFAQVTGLLSIEELCRATIHVAAGIASIGNPVYCKLPEGVIKQPPRFKFAYPGKVVYEPPGQDDGNAADYVMVECLEPMNTTFHIDGSDRIDPDSPLICVLPQDQIPEQVLEAMRERIERKGARDWHFLLMASTKHL